MTRPRNLMLAFLAGFLATSPVRAQDAIAPPPAVTGETAPATTPVPDGTAPASAAPAAPAPQPSPAGAHHERFMPPAPGLPAEPDPMYRWLDEVRTQRQAWEERRRTTKEAMDARRRWINPWGAAQAEAAEQEAQRRRDALRERIERDRETFRNQRPWGGQNAPSYPVSPPATEQPATSEPGEAVPPAAYPPLPGWDNRWYYRGF